MNRRRVLAAAIVCGLAATDAAATYRSVEVAGLRLTMDSDWVTTTAPGYVPVRFDITNTTAEERVIEIIGDGVRWARGMPYASVMVRRGIVSTSVTTTIRREVRLGGSGRVQLTVSAPVLGDTEQYVFRIYEGREELQRFGSLAIVSGRAPAIAGVLFAVDPASAFGQTIASSVLRGAPPVPSSPTGTTIRTGPGAPVSDEIIHPARLPNAWLGYTSLRALAIGPADFKALDDAQRSAILTWVAAGGDLLLIDGTPDHIVAGAPMPAAENPGFAYRYLLGQIHPISGDVLLAGLDAVLMSLPAPAFQSLALPANSAPDWFHTGSLGFVLPIPGVGGVQARKYLLMLVVFSIVIGPVNYVFLRRRGRQALIVLTAPLLSLAFLVLLGGYVVAGEGFRMRGRAATLTILDQTGQQAATRGRASLYAAGMAPSGGIRFERDTAVFPLPSASSASRMTLEWTSAQRYDAMVSARSPVNLETLGVRRARERLTFGREGERVTVVNGLGATITRLSYREGGTTYALEGPLPSGEKGVLRANDAVAVASLVPDPELLPRFYDATQLHPDGTYVAILERSPFWDSGLDDLDERGSFHAVFGIPGSAP